MIDVDAYLARIAYVGPRAPTVETLRGLHLAHMRAAPFENLDIHLGRPIVLDEGRLFEKVVRAGRGGFCYELNGLFAGLLRTLGFRVDMLSARVYDSAEPGPDFDHMCLLVHLEEPWLADVGFGDCFQQPLRLNEAGVQVRNGTPYQLSREHDVWVLRENKGDKDWAPAYQFTLQPRALGDFAEMCVYQQTSPESIFTQKQVCTRATSEGRVTISNKRLITTENGVRIEAPLNSAEAYAEAVREHFAIQLPPVDVDRLVGRA